MYRKVSRLFMFPSTSVRSVAVAIPPNIGDWSILVFWYYLQSTHYTLHSTHTFLPLLYETKLHLSYVWCLVFVFCVPYAFCSSPSVWCLVYLCTCIDAESCDEMKRIVHMYINKRRQIDKKCLYHI